MPIARTGRRRRPRVESSGSPWSIVGIFAGAVGVLVAAIWWASRTHGAIHGLAVVVTVLVGLLAAYLAAMVVFLLGALVAFDWYQAGRLTVSARIGLVVAAAGIGALAGTGAYQVGFAAFADVGLFAIVAVVVRAHVPKIGRWAVGLAAVATAASVAVALTAFLS